MNIKNSCKERRIRNTNISTPLVVPSFSSVISNNPYEIGKIHNSLREYIFQVSLISAYDLYYKHININNISSSGLVFIDSGNYEIDFLKTSKNLKKWSENLYVEILHNLKPLNQFIIINYDKKQPIKDQIINANLLYDKLENIKFSKCFLYKPLEEKSNLINLSELEKNIDEITNYDILGITEKELGNSLLVRCQNIVKIREIFKKAGVELPIHIFGCLDPLTIISFFLCGADIFDGLVWLKYTFNNFFAYYTNNYALMKGDWSNTYDVINMQASIQNLNELNLLSSILKHYIRTKNFESLRLNEYILHQVKSLTGTAGIDY